jgi:pyruvate-ferredoxin/flavodoxin oxidoreductase
MMKSQTEMKRAVESGYWPLFRYNPTAEKPFTWETKEPKSDFQEFIRSERRYTTLLKTNPEAAEQLFAQAEVDAKARMTFLEQLGKIM